MLHDEELIQHETDKLMQIKIEIFETESGMSKYF